MNLKWDETASLFEELVGFSSIHVIDVIPQQSKKVTLRHLKIQVFWKL